MVPPTVRAAGTVLPHHWARPEAQDLEACRAGEGSATAAVVAGGGGELHAELLAALTERAARETATATAGGQPLETAAALRQLATLLAGGAGEVVMRRWDSDGVAMPTMLWRTPGVRGEWADDVPPVCCGEVLALLGPPVEAEGGEGLFVRVQRVAVGGAAAEGAGWAKVKNLRLCASAAASAAAAAAVETAADWGAVEVGAEQSLSVSN